MMHPRMSRGGYHSPTPWFSQEAAYTPFGRPGSMSRQDPGMRHAGLDPVLLNRRAAFDVFDVAHDGTVNSIELPMALMGCDDVRNAVHVDGVRNIREAEIQDAMDRCQVEPGGLVTFHEFSQICDILVQHLAPKRQRRQLIEDRLELAAEGEVNTCRAGSPESPQADTAIITSKDHFPELGSIQKAFYAFDIDRSGSVSGHEIPRMLRMVGIGPKNNNHDQWAAFAAKWHKALRSIYPPKEPTELINVFDFHDMCIVLKPSLVRELPERPPPPPPPVESLSLDELRRLEMDEKKRRVEEERARREEEERIAHSTLHVKGPSGRIFCLLETSADDTVMDVMQRVEDIEGVPVGQQRLVLNGYEMSPKQCLRDYGVRIGHPQRHKAHTVTLLVRPIPQQLDSARNAVGNLYVRTPFNDVYTIHAKRDDGIGEIMRRVEEVSGVPVDQQRLVGNGRELSVLERLRDSHTAPGDTILLLIRNG
ncbi:Polyubiquitin [Diplonema papillatum]|nr:Polyubiquitin [Diplonema papillatum]